MKPHPTIFTAKDMRWGYKGRDFLAFFFFPRTYREIQRLERALREQQSVIARLGEEIYALKGENQ